MDTELYQYILIDEQRRWSMIKLIGVSLLAAVFMLGSMGAYACAKGWHSCKVARIKTCCQDKGDSGPPDAAARSQKN